MMKVHIAVSRNFDDYTAICEAVKKSKFKITELVSGGSKGGDGLTEQWASENKVQIKQFTPEWNNIKAKDADVKEGNWGLYNANAGKDRDQKILDYIDALITIGPSYIATNAKDKNIKVFEYDVRGDKEDQDYLYIFGSEV